MHRAHIYTQTDTIALNSCTDKPATKPTEVSTHPASHQGLASLFLLQLQIIIHATYFFARFLIFQQQRLSSRCWQWYYIFSGRRNERGHVGVREEEKWTGYRCTLHARVCRFSHVQFGLGGWSLQWLNPEAWR